MVCGPDRSHKVRTVWGKAHWVVVKRSISEAGWAAVVAVWGLAVGAADVRQ